MLLSKELKLALFKNTFTETAQPVKKKFLKVCSTLWEILWSKWIKLGMNMITFQNVTIIRLRKFTTSNWLHISYDFVNNKSYSFQLPFLQRISENSLLSTGNSLHYRCTGVSLDIARLLSLSITCHIISIACSVEKMKIKCPRFPKPVAPKRWQISTPVIVRFYLFLM